MDKQMVYGALFGLGSAFFAYIEWYWPAGFLLGFAFGFIFAVDRVYKVATGKTLTSPRADEVYKKIL